MAGILCVKKRKGTERELLQSTKNDNKETWKGEVDRTTKEKKKGKEGEKTIGKIRVGIEKIGKIKRIKIKHTNAPFLIAGNKKSTNRKEHKISCNVSNGKINSFVL